MFQLNRRALLRSGLLLSAGNLFLKPRLAVTQALLGATAQAENEGPIHPRRRAISLRGSNFSLTSIGDSSGVTAATRPAILASENRKGILPRPAISNSHW